jgi:hypothetical protein
MTRFALKKFRPILKPVALLATALWGLRLLADAPVVRPVGRVARG